MYHPSRAHEAGHCIACIALGGEVVTATVRAAGGGLTVYRSGGLTVVERAAVLMAGAEAEMLFAGTNGPDAYGPCAESDKAKVRALGLSVRDELDAFDLCRAVLRANVGAVRALAAILTPGVVLNEHEILNATRGRVVYFTGAVR